MSERRRRLLLRTAQLLAVLVVSWALFRTLGVRLSELKALRGADWRPAAAPLVLSSVLLLAVYLAHALLWRAVMADLGVGRPAVRTTIRLYFLASLGRYVPGKVWQVAGLAVLASRAGLPPVGATAAALFGQLAFLVSGAVFLAVAMPTGRGAVAGVAALLGVIASLWLLRCAAGQRLAEALRARVPRLGTVVDLVTGVRPGHAARWGVAYGLTWILLGGAFVLFVISFYPDAGGHLRYVAGTVAASYLGGYIAVFAPAGIGVREGLMGVLLADVMPAPAALVVSLASRLWFTAVELLPLLALPALRGHEGAPERNPIPGTP
ncbi:MAG: hypothetical protein DIU52_002825 [bacterium]